MQFANLILPLALPQLYTYAIPAELEGKIRPGQRVLVQFGKKKIYSSIVAKIHHTAPDSYDVKPILEVIDEHPLLDQHQLDLIRWIAEYYMCTEGEILKSAIPAGLRLSSESNIALNPEAEIDTSNIDDREKLIVERLYQTDSLTFQEVEKLLNKKSIHKYIRSLLSREYIVLYEQVSDRYQPKKVSKVKLALKYQSEEEINALFEFLAKKPKQTDWILAFLKETESNLDSSVEKHKLTENNLLSVSSLKTMVKNGVFEEFKEVISRFPEMSPDLAKDYNLSDEQQKALLDIIELYAQKDVVLLHGITGSGKTEIYIRLIKEILAQEQQVLFLVPEIALTTQLVSRLKQYLGDDVGVYHSRYSDNERVEIWEGIVQGRFKVVVGVRSSIFLPFHDLGLIIVDEEHEGSFKQFEPNPRYNARDTAMVLAKLHNAKVLLGSATPSLETYFQAKNNHYGLVELHQRYGEATLPVIRLVDIQKARRSGSITGIFSNELLVELRACLERGEQAIFLQNRRGYSPMISCEMCNWTPKCVQCEVTLTLHQYSNELRCHYCGYRKTPPSHCSACGSAKMSTVGYGTEKIEEELKLLVPNARIDRMDLETTRNVGAFERIINKFEHNETNVLVGTQMVSKGLDFDNVTLVGVLNADNMLNFPDFRATERSFQMLMQVSGRAGRKNKKGLVLIQTFDPTQSVFDYIQKQDYQSFYLRELSERSSLIYPPVSRLINLTIKHRDRTIASNFIHELAKNLKVKMPAKCILGPAIPYISRIRNFYIFELLIKLDRNANNKAYKKFILEQIDLLKFQKSENRNIVVVSDVDPI